VFTCITSTGITLSLLVAKIYTSIYIECRGLFEESNQKLFKKRFRLDVRKFAFSNRVVNDWNSLSSQFVNSCTVHTFKKIFQLIWNRKLLNYISCVLFEIVGVNMTFKPACSCQLCLRCCWLR